MNKQRRKELEDLHDDLQNLLESYNAIYSMQEACECITSAINNLEEIE